MRNMQRLFGGALVLVLSSTTVTLAAEQRTYTAGNVSLEINGERVMATSARGGHAVAQVVGTPAPDGTTINKHIANVFFEDIVFTVPPTSLPNAVTGALGGKAVAVDGGIDYLDYNFKSLRRMAFNDAMVTGIRFPALDAASKDASKVEVTLSPQSTRAEPGKDAVANASMKQKSHLVSNFRVQLGDLPTNRVATVSPIELRMKRSDDSTGIFREPTKQPTPFEIPNITLSISSVDAQPWLKWHADSVIAGQSDEKTMRVDLLSPDMKTALLTLELTGVGVVAVRQDAGAASSDKINRAEVELYAEGLKVISPGSNTKSATPVAAETAKEPAASKEPSAAAPAAEDAPAQKEGARMTRAQRERLRARAAEAEKPAAPAR